MEFRTPKMRTVHEAAQEIKALDPHTAITEYHIRQLSLNGTLPTVKAGRKKLINFDLLLEYLADPTAERFRVVPTATANGIRPIV